MDDGEEASPDKLGVWQGEEWILQPLPELAQERRKRMHVGLSRSS
jgi:hypothetical protein